MINPRNPDDEVLGQWVHEAGAQIVSPQPQYVETLRATILKRLKAPTRPISRTTARAALFLVATAAMVFVGFLVWNREPDISWAQVVAAVRTKPWIHITARLPDGTQIEEWFSPQTEVWASREGDRVSFTDYRAKVCYTYNADKKVLLRVVDTGGSKQQLLSFQRLLEEILRGDRVLSSPLPDMALIRQTRSEIAALGRSWVVYELVLRRDTIENRLRFRVDPQTRLVDSMTISAPVDEFMRSNLNEEFAKGKLKGKPPSGDRLEVTMAFDYPSNGPADIFAMGVPRTVPIEDRVPKGDLARVINGVNESREKFPKTYLAIVTHGFGTGYLPAPQFVWRKGGRWRREYRLPVARTPEERKAIKALKLPPAGTDMVAWWKEKTQGWRVQPIEFFDGNAVYAHISKTLEPEWKKTYQGASAIFVGEIQRLLPEQQGYPHLSASSEHLTIELQQSPKDGPSGTIFITVRSIAPKGMPLSGCLARYWIDPAKSYLAVRREFSNIDPENGKPKGPGEVWTVENAAQAPNGIWYPTEFRRKGTVDQDGKGTFVDDIWCYYVDFNAEIPGNMFKPQWNK